MKTERNVEIRVACARTFSEFCRDVNRVRIRMWGVQMKGDLWPRKKEKGFIIPLITHYTNPISCLLTIQTVKQPKPPHHSSSIYSPSTPGQDSPDGGGHPMADGADEQFWWSAGQLHTVHFPGHPQLSYRHGHQAWEKARQKVTGRFVLISLCYQPVLTCLCLLRVNWSFWCPVLSSCLYFSQDLLKLMINFVILHSLSLCILFMWFHLAEDFIVTVCVRVVLLFNFSLSFYTSLAFLSALLIIFFVLLFQAFLFSLLISILFLFSSPLLPFSMPSPFFTISPSPPQRTRRRWTAWWQRWWAWWRSAPCHQSAAMQSLNSSSRICPMSALTGEKSSSKWAVRFKL